MDILRMFFAWLSQAPESVQMATVAAVTIVSIFAFSNDSIHGIIVKFFGRIKK